MQNAGGRRAGQSAREKAKEYARAAPIWTFFARIFNLKSDERSWRIGAEGEERVGALLEPLRAQGWWIGHDVQIGTGRANIDHLLIGPAGVFVINTKVSRNPVWIAGPNVRIGSLQVDHVHALEGESRRVRERLTDAAGIDNLWVTGLLVFVKTKVTLKQQPRFVHVLTERDLVPHLLRQPSKLRPEQIGRLVKAASIDQTWR